MLASAALLSFNLHFTSPLFKYASMALLIIEAFLNFVPRSVFSSMVSNQLTLSPIGVSLLTCNVALIFINSASNAALDFGQNFQSIVRL
jgi:hypothetical protein